MYYFIYIGISPGRGGSRRGRRGGHRENRGGGHKGGADGEPSSSDRGRGKRGGGHPSGLSGKDIGLWYARRGKEKKKQRDIENVRLNNCQYFCNIYV